ncbi:tryptophan synthase, alpha chain [Methanospirillum hungatei JF-1]|uniref:Tryptophan synthase alpha chain n=3 Tax=Methanospirillum hungatei TaxID=2203 RepID=Q2FKX6_METHJ|nr:tryptophan synthase subunit alpha [Methanospirillum hungatei]ABD41512.1 tryptophan synthase, alpha chain [Methanospirillum hungatei JF-1]
MNRLKEAFETRTKSLLMTFTVAGDPDFETSLEIIKALENGGADIIELGLPFSDPVADGPVIQQADQRALASGMNTDRFFDLVREVRKSSDIPLVVLTYTNLILQRDINTFYQDAADAGIDAVVVADLPYEEAGPYITAAETAGVAPVMMVSTTTSPERLSKILTVKSGFIYLVAALGVTGMRQKTDPVAQKLLADLKNRTDIPIAPGFGISDREQVREWTDAGADAVIVGSALVREIEDSLVKPDTLIPRITAFVQSLK